MASRYSFSVVAPIHCSSPRARAGFKMLAVSSDPWVLPAPTIVCISSMKRIMSLPFSSLMIVLIRSSNSPRNFVPATSEEMSSEKIRLCNSVYGTFFWIIRRASPSTMADLPTPASPISTGLFFLRRPRIWMTRSISASRPTIRSSSPSAAARVRSVPNLDNSSSFFCFPSVMVIRMTPDVSRSEGDSASGSGSSFFADREFISS